MEDYSATLILTFQLAILTSLILFLIGIPIAYYLAFSKSKIKSFIEAIVSLPLVLPPTVIGFYLLFAFGPRTLLGSFLQQTLGINLNFSFEGILIGSVLYSLPFMVHPIQSGLQGLPASLLDASYTLGKSRFATLIKVLLPNIRPSLLSGLVLSFAHTIGEFGVILMIGGSIPGETRVASIAIYDEVESLNYQNAHFFSITLLLLSFTILFLLYVFNKRLQSRKVL